MSCSARVSRYGPDVVQGKSFTSQTGLPQIGQTGGEARSHTVRFGTGEGRTSPFNIQEG